MISKAKFMKKMAAVVIAGAMMTVMAVPVIAATSPIGKGVDGLKISKTLEKYENSYIPNTTFGFEIAPGVADPDNKVEVGLAMDLQQEALVFHLQKVISGVNRKRRIQHLWSMHHRSLNREFTVM